MFWLVLCLAAAIVLAWYVRRTNAGSTGYDIYEDDTLPDFPYPGWNYWQYCHLHHHHHHPSTGSGDAFGGGSSSHQSGGGAGGGGGSSW